MSLKRKMKRIFSSRNSVRIFFECKELMQLDNFKDFFKKKCGLANKLLLLKKKKSIPRGLQMKRKIQVPGKKESPQTEQGDTWPVGLHYTKI